MRAKMLSVMAGGLIMAAVPMLAHHSFSAEYDRSQPIQLKGTVTKVEWMNPHARFYLDVKDDASGKVTNWEFELGSPNGLMRQGWTRNSLKVGDVVEVKGSRPRMAPTWSMPRTCLSRTASAFWVALLRRTIRKRSKPNQFSFFSAKRPAWGTALGVLFLESKAFPPPVLAQSPNIPASGNRASFQDSLLLGRGRCGQDRRPGCKSGCDIISPGVILVDTGGLET